MLHVSKTVMDTFVQTTVANPGGIPSKLFEDAFWDHVFTYDSTFIQDLEPVVSKSKPGDTKIEFNIRMSQYTGFNISNDNLWFYSDMNFGIYDEDGTLVTDIGFDGAEANIDITSDPLMASVDGNVNLMVF